MRGKNGRFAKKETEEDAEIQAIEKFENTDLWVFKVMDAFIRALVGLLLRLGIQMFFVLLFAVILKKIGMLDLIKEIISMVLDIFNYAKVVTTNTKDETNGSTANTNVSADKKSYFS